MSAGRIQAGQDGAGSGDRRVGCGGILMSVKLDLSTPRAERRNSCADVLLLKPVGSTVADNLDLRARPETLASRVRQFPFLARFAVINLVGVALLAQLGRRACC